MTLERHSRIKTDWGSQPPRSEIVRAAAEADELNKKVPGRKDRRGRCKAARGPHVPEIVLDKWGDPCKWGTVWLRRQRKEAVGWNCRHIEACVRCGKLLRYTIRNDECPDFPGSDAQRQDAERKAAEMDERRAAWSLRRKPPVTGPQHYRKPRK